MSKREDELELYAQTFRRDHGLNDSEPLRLKSLLQKAEVLTVYKPLSSNFSGMAIKIASDLITRRFMLVNCDHPRGKQHFTICHELYHLFVQSNFKSATSCSGKFDKSGDHEEYNADIFASHLLLPKFGVLGMIPPQERIKNKITLETVLEIEQYYASSHSALLFRLLNIGLIDHKYRENLSSGIVGHARRLGYNTSLYEKCNNGVVIGDYGQLAYKAWGEGVISESAYLGLLEDIGVDVTNIFDAADGDF